MAIDFSSLAVGTVVAAFAPPPCTREDLARYAEASGDSNPLHLDPAFARQAGFDDLVVHGMLGMAHLGRLLTRQFATERIRSYTVRFEGVVMVGQQVNYAARYLEMAPDGAVLDLEAVLESGKRVISGKAVISS